MRFTIDIETHDPRLGFDLFGPQRLGHGTTTTAPGPATITCAGLLVRKAIDVPSVLKLIVDVAVDVEVGLFVAWLYDQVKNTNARIERNTRTESVTIRRSVVTEITQERIYEAIEEEIRRG